MRLNKWSLAVIAAALGVGSAVVAGSRRSPASPVLPPLGQRLYSLGSQESPAPVVIERSKDQDAVADRYMRDPDQPGHLKVAPPRPKTAPKVVENKEKAGRLRFQRLHVAGHLQQPRVAFKLDNLPLERADEPLNNDFYPKVFEPARDDAF